MLEAIIVLIAWIIALIIYLSPVILIGVIIYRYKKRKNKQTERKNNKFQSEWVWDENRQLWVHESEFAKQIHIIHNRQTSTRPSEPMVFYPRKQTQSEGTYRYDYFHIPDENQTKFHHNDTTFKVKQKPGTKEPINTSKTTAYKQKKYEKPEQKPNNKTSPRENIYQAKSILTYNERRNYKTLKEAADEKGYEIIMKPRIADIASPREKNQGDFNRISQKHVDFAILDKNLNIIAVIELDDSSHDTTKGKERDAFKDSVLRDCGYKIIHTRYIWPDILDNI